MLDAHDVQDEILIKTIRSVGDFTRDIFVLFLDNPELVDLQTVL